MLQQAEFHQDGRVTHGVVDHPRRLRRGATCTLSGEPGRWTVGWCFPLPRAVPRGWNNNI